MFMPNLGLATLLNKSPNVSSAFYKMQGGVISFYIVFPRNSGSS